MRRFPLAPMNGLILWLTVFLLPLPLMVGLAGVAAGTALLWIPAGFIVVVYGVVWFFMRPAAFELSETSLDIVFPLRRIAVPMEVIGDAEFLSGKEFRARYGLGYRIGAGGLWGGFGLYRTRTVTFQFYISRVSDLVVLRRSGDRPLLITPRDPKGFIGELEALRA